MAKHNELGDEGEMAAVRFLSNKGYVILERNWRENHHEIDIIALDGEEIVFVEVKTRSDIVFGRPEDAITPRKISMLIKAADHYLRMNHIDYDARFDVIAMSKGSTPYIKHYEKAFHP